MKVLACTEWDDVSNSCVVEAWIEWPGVLPPLPAEQGLQIAGLMIALVATAWGYKFLRRFLAPRFG